MTKRYFYGDIESFSVGRQYDMSPREFFRLGQFAINDGPVILTEDYDYFMKELRASDYIIFHNGISFDMSVLFGYDSIEPLQMAMGRRVIDTYYLANLLNPVPQSYRMRSGRYAVESSDPVGHAKSWLSLDNQCYNLGLPGKIGDLKEIAKRYNPPGTKVADLEYGLIDVNDPEFREYSEQDVIALRVLFKRLMQIRQEQNYSGEYIWRYMEILSATVGQMHRNGIKANVEYAQGRIQEQEKQKSETMAMLVEKYDFPTEGKAPWSSAKGKEATLKVLADYGFTPENTPEWEETPKGAPKLGGKDLLTFAEGTPAEDFVRGLAELKGMRSISQLVMDNMKPDGRVHPDITALQRSGRWSFTNPGVTIFGEHSENLKADKALFIADEGNVLAGFDYSSADARAMAAMSGDEEYAKRFERDENGNDIYDAHNLTGEAVFGADLYYAGGERGAKARPPLRFPTKAIGHGSNYSIGAYKLANSANKACRENGLDLFFWAPAGKNKDGSPRAKPIPVPDKYKPYIRNDELLVSEDNLPEGLFLTRTILEDSKAAYAWLTMFKEKQYEFAKEHGYVMNAWGRKLPVIKERAYTQSSAQLGQNATAEMMGDAILRLIRKGEYYIRALRAIIHDELLLEFDEKTIDRDVAVVKECMEHVFDPRTNVSMPILFPVGVGYGKTWRDAAH